MTSLTTKGTMSLPCCRIRRGGRCQMAARAQGNCGHGVRMGMIIKFGAMASLTGCASGFAGRQAGQEASVGTMTGNTATGSVRLSCSDKRSSGPGLVMTVGTKRHISHAVGMRMEREVNRGVTGSTSTTRRRHLWRRADWSQQHACRHIMAGCAGVMNLIVGRAHRDTCYSTSRCRMAGSTGSGGSYPRRVIRVCMVDEIGGVTGVTGTTTSRHSRGLAILCQQAAVCVVAV